MSSKTCFEQIGIMLLNLLMSACMTIGGSFLYFRFIYVSDNLGAGALIIYPLLHLIIWIILAFLLWAIELVLSKSNAKQNGEKPKHKQN